jgi:hypothetical protein
MSGEVFFLIVIMLLLQHNATSQQPFNAAFYTDANCTTPFVNPWLMTYPSWPSLDPCSIGNDSTLIYKSCRPDPFSTFPAVLSAMYECRSSNDTAYGLYSLEYATANCTNYYPFGYQSFQCRGTVTTQCTPCYYLSQNLSKIVYATYSCPICANTGKPHATSDGALLSGGAIIGIVIAAIFVFIVVISLICFYRYRYRAGDKSSAAGTVASDTEITNNQTWKHLQDDQHNHK